MSAMELQAFLTGFKFQFRLDSFELRLHSNSRAIIRQGVEYPNFHFQVNNIVVKAGIIGKDVATQFTVKDISITDYMNKHHDAGFY